MLFGCKVKRFYNVSGQIDLVCVCVVNIGQNNVCLQATFEGWMEVMEDAVDNAGVRT